MQRVPSGSGQQPAPPPRPDTADPRHILEITLIQTIAFTRGWRSLLLDRDFTVLHLIAAVAQMPWFVLGYLTRSVGVVVGILQGQVLYRDAVVVVIEQPRNRRPHLTKFATPLALLNLAVVAVLVYASIAAVGVIKNTWGAAAAVAVLMWAAAPGLIDFHLPARRHLRGRNPIASSIARAPWQRGRTPVTDILRSWVPPTTYLLAYEPLVTGTYLRAWPDAIATRLDDGIRPLPQALRPPLCLVIVHGVDIGRKNG